ncbi:hypothetical protein ACIPW5_37960 [Streptomyces sp. NPDC090077]
METVQTSHTDLAPCITAPPPAVDGEAEWLPRLADHLTDALTGTGS